MDPTIAQSHLPTKVWQLAAAQHGVVARRQLLAAGLHADAIKHRVATGRLHRRAAGVYAVGRPHLGRLGEMMVAVLACGPDAALSHESAAELWGLRRRVSGPVEVSVPARTSRRRPGVKVHRREASTHAHRTVHRGIPVHDVASY